MPPGKESKKVRVFLKDIEKLVQGDDGMLYRHTDDKQQLVLSKKWYY